MSNENQGVQGVREKVLMCWSGGKDSAFALHELRQSGRYEVVALLTTVNSQFGRVSMHGVRREMLEAQARALELPLHVVELYGKVSMEEYAEKMRESLQEFLAAGVWQAAFGDLFLEDVRSYREKNLQKVGMKALFPLWGCNTAHLAREFLELGFRAVVVTVDAKVLDESFAGRPFDESFLKDLPAGVDPCAENGEFHSFVFDGPGFRQPVAWRLGEKVTREGFVYCDILPA